MKRNIVLTVIFSFGLVNNLSSQVTFWSEDFNGYANGVTTGANNNTINPANDWTSGGCTTCSASSNDWWEIRNGLMEARDVNNENVYLQTESIDISIYSSVTMNIDVLENGDLEGLYLGVDDCTDIANQDYADVEYRIDGGTWILVENYLGWCGLYSSCGTHTLYGDDNNSGDCRTVDTDWISTTVSVSGLVGNTLEIRLSTTNSSGTEYIRFDNIDIQYISILPIELLSFDTKVQNSLVYLNWQTASEINNDFFTIERSNDGYSWENVITIDGAGNSSTILSYSAVDYNPYSEISYYRLKQTDFDGQFSYSQIKSVNIDTIQNSIIEIYPNPADNQITITGNESDLKQVKIYNILGQDLTGLTKFSYSNKQKLVIDLSNLNSGIYHIKTKTTANNKLYKQ